MKGILFLALTSLAIPALADSLPYTNDELTAHAKVAVDRAVAAHHESGFHVTGYQAGRVTRGGATFYGTVVFYSYDDGGEAKKGEDVTNGLDRGALPNPLLGWLVSTPSAGEAFTLGELTTVAKLTVDQSRIDNGNVANHEVATFKVYESTAEFPVMARVAWRHTDPATGEVAKGEDKYGCHKHDAKIECHRVQ